MTFEDLNKKMIARFTEMQQHKLFYSSVTGNEVWDNYITGFLPEENPVFRDPNSSHHNCNNDNNFIRRYGNIVAISSSGEILTMFDIEVEGDYKTTIPKLSNLLKSKPVSSNFVETFAELNQLPYARITKSDLTYQLGMKLTNKMYTPDEVTKFGKVVDGKVYTFHHFHVFLDKKFVDFSNKSQASILAELNSAKDVFKRGLEEISVDTLELVRDLIVQGSLLNGASYLDKIVKFIELKKLYNNFTGNKDNFCWYHALGLPFAKFRNELIGTLCVDLTQGMNLNEACQTWNKRVDPANYMKAVAPITETQKKLAAQQIDDLGYTESFTSRRYALPSDIRIEEIHHRNVDGKIVAAAGLFNTVKTASNTQHKKSQFDTVETVSYEKFMKDILPTATAVHVLVENRFQNNLVSLFTGEGKNMFKWDNQVCWTYSNNLTGVSALTKMVEDKGGRTDGVFRFTHSWNRLAPNQSLMDLHVFMPNCEIPKQNSGGPNVKGHRVGWNNRKDIQSGGNQDVDYTSQAPSGYVPVENITFPDINKMPKGRYECFVHNWSFRNTGGEGEAEIAINGELFQYVYPKTKNHQWVHVATVTLGNNNQFTIEHHLTPTFINREFWGLKAGEFHKCSLVCYSPNFWGNNAVGNKHVFFMLGECKADIPLRTFHNEYLNNDLVPHRAVLDVLGMTRTVDPTDDQLSGIGFNTTVNDEVVLKIEGTHKRIIKIRF